MLIVVVDGCNLVLCEIVGIIVCCWIYLQVVFVVNFDYILFYYNIFIEFYILLGLFMFVFLLGCCFLLVCVEMLDEVIWLFVFSVKELELELE